MGIEVVVDHRFSRRVRKSLLREAARKTLRFEKVRGQPGLTIVIAGDDTIRRLHKRYLGESSPTDVLSFGSDDAGYLGDIIISYDTASGNARLYGWGVQNELSLLVVHGLLHLLGYDDHTPIGRAKMWRTQGLILGDPRINDGRLDKPRGHSRSEAG